MPGGSGGLAELVADAELEKAAVSGVRNAQMWQPAFQRFPDGFEQKLLECNRDQ